MFVMSIASGSAPGTTAYFGSNIQNPDLKEGLPKYYQSETEAVRLYGGVPKALGIDRVDAETFGKLLLGWAPDGSKLRQNAGNGDDAAWDLTMSCDKSVSIAYANGDDETRERILSQVFGTCESVVGHAERVVTTRRGHGGTRHEAVDGLLVVAIPHLVSRWGDVQLHVHLLFINTCLRQDGTYGALHSRDLYTHKKAFGRLAAAEAAAYWRSEGVRLETTEYGARFAEIPKELCEESSRGRRAILERANDLGVFSPEAMEAINLDLRPPKDAFNMERLQEQWREQGKAHGVDEKFVRQMFGRKREIDLAARRVNARRAARKAIAETELVSSTFRAAEITSLAAHYCRDGRAGLDDIVRAVDHELNKSAQVTTVGVERGHKIFSTVRNELLELQASEIAEASRQHRQHVIGGDVVQSAIHELGLDPEQAKAVRLTTKTRGSIKLITGIAGTGKTRTLEGVRVVEEAAGRRLIGAAPTGVAREELRSGAGLAKCFTVTKLLQLLDPSWSQSAIERASGIGQAALKVITGKGIESLHIYSTDRLRLGRRDTIVLDEAAMVGFHDMTRLMELCQEAGAKLVLCGDDKQLGPVLAGASLFSELKRGLGAARLTKNWRQRKHGWLQQLNSHLVNRESEEALRLLVEKDRLQISRGLNSPLQACADYYLEHGVHEAKENLVVASTRAQVNALNERVQEARRKRGDLGGSIRLPSEATESSEQRVHVNDRVLLRHNDARVSVQISGKMAHGQRVAPGGVVNGDFGTVVATAGRKIRVLLDRRSPKGERQLATIDLRQYPNVELGYAVTATRAQGRTVKRALLLADSAYLDAEQGYVAMTRQAEDLQVFAHEITLGEELRNLARALRRSRREELAVEARRRLQQDERSEHITLNQGNS